MESLAKRLRSWLGNHIKMSAPVKVSTTIYQKAFTVLPQDPDFFPNSPRNLDFSTLPRHPPTSTINMVNFHITEPHPSVKSSYIYSGRGGAGNAMRISSKEVTHGATASGPASRTKLPSPLTNTIYATGRGGAGNMKKTERAIFSFDEELRQQERLRSQQAPVFHIGRGGAGNLVGEMKPRSQRQNSASSSSSVESDKDGVRRSVDNAWKMLSRQFSNPQ